MTYIHVLLLGLLQDIYVQYSVAFVPFHSEIFPRRGILHSIEVQYMRDFKGFAAVSLLGVTPIYEAIIVSRSEILYKIV